MQHLTLPAAKMLVKRLKRILVEDFGEEVRLGWRQSAIAEAFDFESSSEMFAMLPKIRTWNREWCINHLIDEGRTSDMSIARAAVALLEERFGRLLVDPPEAVGDPDDFSRP